MTDGHRRLAGDLALGVVAGAAATWMMDKVTTALYARESNEAIEAAFDIVDLAADLT